MFALPIDFELANSSRQNRESDLNDTSELKKDESGKEHVCVFVCQLQRPKTLRLSGDLANFVLITCTLSILSSRSLRRGHSNNPGSEGSSKVLITSS